MVRNRCGPSGILNDQRSARSSSGSQFPFGVMASQRPPSASTRADSDSTALEVRDVLQHVDREDAVELRVAERQPLPNRHHTMRTDRWMAASGASPGSGRR